MKLKTNVLIQGKLLSILSLKFHLDKMALEL